jgi:hypothetical protein
MKTQTRLAAAGAIAAAFLLAPPAFAQTTAAKPAQVKDAEAVTNAVEVTALVTAIDQKNRIVTLRGPEGNEFSVLVDERVKNLPQVKVGDMLVVRYIEAVALEFKKGDGIRMATMIDTSETAKKGQMPGAGAFTRVNTVSNIWAVNQAKGTVLVRGPFGHFVEVKLKDPSLLSGVKVGDQMQVTFTQAVAIGMVRAKS